jgi:hypothetical protein
MSRRGCSLPANASGVDPHHASITGVLDRAEERGEAAVRRRAQLMDGLSYPLSVAWALRHRRLQPLLQGLGTATGGGGGGGGGGGAAVRRPLRPFRRPFWLRFTYVTSVLVKKYRDATDAGRPPPAPRR